MAELSDLQIDAAMEHGRIVRLTEPRATSARFDRSAGRLVVELTNGCIFAVPPQLAQGPENATEDQLAQVNGHGLHWETRCRSLGSRPIGRPVRNGGLCSATSRAGDGLRQRPLRHAQTAPKAGAPADQFAADTLI